MFEDIIGKEKVVRKIKKKINLMPKQRKRREVMKRALKIRKELYRYKPGGDEN